MSKKEKNIIPGTYRNPLDAPVNAWAKEETNLQSLIKLVKKLIEHSNLTQKQIGELQEHSLKLEKQIWELQDQQK